MTHELAVPFRERTGTSRLAKNERIASRIWETKERRRTQACRTYQLKVDMSHLGVATPSHLKLLFLEAKWFYNDALARGNILGADYRRKRVLVKCGSEEFETRVLAYLSAQMRQEIVDRAKDNVRSLASLKARGYKVGQLKFKSRVASIPLKQYGKTHQILGNYIKIQNISQPLKVMGIDQIPKDAEFASAVFEMRGGAFFIRLSTFRPKSEGPSAYGAVGIDLGIAKQMSLSNGLELEEGVPESKRIGRIRREFSRRMRYGKNRRKSLLKLERENEKLNNHRRDIRNKIVSEIVSSYSTVVVQDDNISVWQKIWGRQMRRSAIGGITSALKERAHTLVTVPRSVPTTKQCSRCKATQQVALRERTYKCVHCGFIIDRNLNSAINILDEGVPAGRRESTPVDMKTAARMMRRLNSVSGILASLVKETGSPRNQIS